MFTTKVNLILKDCRNNIIYTGLIGKSKEKGYKKAFHEAIRNAFKDPVIKNYSYRSKVNITKAQPKVKKAAVSNTAIPNKITKSKSVIGNVLYAQVTNNGFQLVDTTPKLIFKILKTKQENVFIIENKNGILYKNNSIWIAEFYENNVLIQKEYQVKFQ
jgi:hypothetical protein